MSGKVIVDLGCGMRKKPGSIGVDCNPAVKPDVLHSLDVFPYPFEDSSIDVLYADNSLEHLSDVIKAMEEIHRITKNGATVKIIVPYFRTQWAFNDPTHKQYFSVDSLSYFDPGHVHSKLYPYSKATFRVERIVFNENIPRGLFFTLVKWFANRWPVRYELYLSHLLPLDELTFYLTTLK